MSEYGSSTVKSKSVFDQNAPESVTNSLDNVFGGPRIGTAGPGVISISSSNVNNSSTASGGSQTASSSNLAAANSSVSGLPSWIGSLATASIARDMSAAIVGGQVTYSGLLTLLNDVASTLSSSKTTLTAAQLSDLKTITANLNNGGITTSAYLSGLMNSLILGSSANATWTGGNASSVALGNLVAGSSATQLSELIGKWFLGTDLPSSQVNVSGSKFSVTYSNSANPLFGVSGPSWTAINQGDLGDCYLESSLAEVAYLNPSVISSMITVNGNGTYGVRFYVNGVADYVTVNSELAGGGSIFNQGADIWASLVEKAYAQLQAGGVCTGNTVNYGNSWSTIGNGGSPGYALAEITGSTTITDYCASGSTWACDTFNSSESLISASSGNSTAAIQQAMIAELSGGDDLILSSYTNAKDSKGMITLVADHAMSIYGYDASTGMFEIRNPWGTEAGQTWDTTFEVSLTTLLADEDEITADNLGGPQLTSQTAAQTWRLGQAVSFTLAANTFTDPHGETLTYKATQSNGSALPSWLTFNASTDTFTGTAPNAASALTIEVTATDTSGLSTSETFSAAVLASAPVVTAQTATQTWAENSKVSFTLPSNTFTDPQGEKLTYSATQSNGWSLPSWLSFNSSTGVFSGTAPGTATSLQITVTATDTSKLSASETFTVSIAAAANGLAHAISAANPGPASAITNLIRPMQGDHHHVFGPRA
jgi:hypothetical protein